MQILWNGVPTRKFKPIRGIREGYPLSAYLFVLCMDWLGHIIQKEMEIGNWDFIRLSHNGPVISHLFFADDLVIFGTTNLDQARLLDSILNQFYEISGHKISVGKSNIFFSKSTPEDVRNQINQIFSFQEVQNLGRIILAQSVLLFIPNYFMQSLMILRGVCLEIEKLARQFIWGRNVGHSKISSVSWNSVCQPQSRGGLGFRFLEEQNKSFLMKIWFSLVSNRDALWRSISKIWALFCENSTWSFGDGAAIRCWKDSWIPGMGSLVSKIPSFSNLDLDCCVREIISIPPPHPDSGPDRVIWAQSPSGVFSVRSAYGALKELTWNPPNERLEYIWKYPGPQRVIIFLWLAYKQRLLTNSECDCPFAKDVWMLVLARQLKQRLGFTIISDISWVFLSTDGALVRDSRYADIRGVARDHDRNWIVGYSHFLGVCSLFEAEVWAILNGILILLNKRYRKISILTDNLEVAQVLSASILEDLGITVLRRTQRIMREEGMWKIKHIPRNQNLVADRVAKLSLSWKSSLQVFNEAPKEVIDLLQEDKKHSWFM
ncbi:hypothetical protein CXB51_015601 [Gossypium anomalum]|uniref:Reverse transcriptase domain-containing protein n=1 Tax=Gossypium anomalum TaxID=47600 RepID=A0A8J5YUS0_9ROSI|nr:hypothetical protein CXB51_015601 [Gossypium anomalum]